jgi:WD40 repeat protein
MKRSILLLTACLVMQLVYGQTADLFRKAGHQSAIRDLSIAPDNKHFISVDENGLAIIWDIASKQQFRAIKDVLNASFAPDNQSIYLAMKDKTFRLIDITGTVIKQFAAKGYDHYLFRSRQFYPEQGIFITDERVIDINKGYLRPIRPEKWGMGQDYSPVLGQVAVGGDNGVVSLCSIETGLPVRKFKLNFRRTTLETYRVAFSKDGTKLLAYKYDSLSVTDVGSGKIVRTILAPRRDWGSIMMANLSPDGNFLAMSTYDMVYGYDVQTGRKIWEKKHNMHEVGYGFFGNDDGILKFTGDGKKILLGTAGSFLWVNAATGAVEKEFINSPITYYQRLFIANNGQSLITQENRKHLIKWDLTTGGMEKSVAYSFPDRSYYPSKDGKSFFTSTRSESSPENLVEVNEAGKEAWKYRTMPKEGMTIADGVSYNGQYVLCRGTSFDPQCKGDKWVAEVFDTKTHKRVLSKVCGVEAARFVNTRNIIAVKEGWQSKRIDFYEVPSGQLLYAIDVPTLESGNIEMFFSPDDQYLALPSSSKARGLTIVNLKTRRSAFYTSGVLDTMAANRYDYAEIMGFTPDSKYLIYNAGKLFFFDIEKGRFDDQLMYQPDHAVTDIAFSKNSRFAFVNAWGNIKVLDLLKKKAVATLYPDGKTGNWAVIMPDGRFDANKGAQANMYHVTGTDIIPLDAMFEKFYTPRLLPRILEGEEFEPVPDANKLKKAPLVKLQFKEGSRNLEVEDDVATIQTKAGTASITVTAECPTDAVSEIRLYQNGKLVQTTRNLVVEDEKAGDKILVKTFAVELTEGENYFKAIALNSQRTESKPAALIAQYKPEKASPANTGDATSGIQLHLVVVGINTYKNAKYNLNYARADAEAFKAAMENGSKTIFSKVNTIFIKDAEADKAGLTAAFEKVKAAANPKDLFVFYYAGHGVMNDNKEFYLVPHDVTQLYGNDGALTQKGISATEIQQFSKDIKAQKQLYILDACQSAAALDAVALRGAAEEKAIAQLARSTGTHWLTASGSEQFASEFNQLAHGSFTYCLLEAFKGEADNGDKKLTVKELDAYLQSKVPEITQKYKGTAQYPASYGYGNDFPVIMVKQ